MAQCSTTHVVNINLDAVHYNIVCKLHYVFCCNWDVHLQTVAKACLSVRASSFTTSANIAIIPFLVWEKKGISDLADKGAREEDRERSRESLIEITV